MTELKPRPFCVGNARKDAEALREILVDDCVDFPHVVHTMLHKAACLIESLSEELEQVKRERDAVVEDLRGRCFACAHARPHDKYPQFKTCQFISSAVGGNGKRECEHWQWRGVKEE